MLPSTSPANAAVPYEERLRWFRALREWLEPTQRQAVRALVVDAERPRPARSLSSIRSPGDAWWATPGGGIEPGETDEQALRRELREEAGLDDFELGPLVVHERDARFPGQAASCTSSSASTSCGSTATSPRRRST